MFPNLSCAPLTHVSRPVLDSNGQLSLVLSWLLLTWLPGWLLHSKLDQAVPALQPNTDLVAAAFHAVSVPTALVLNDRHTALYQRLL